MMIRFLCLTILFEIFTSCNYQLIEKTKQWNPYQAGDVLVFESNNDRLDTIFITNIEQYFEGKNEILKVDCNFIDHDSYSEKKVDTVNSWLMALTQWENGKAVLSINLNTKKARFAPFNAKSLSKLDSMPKTSINLGFDRYKDVMVFEPDTNSTNYSVDLQDSIFVNKILWSKSAGLIRYEINRTETVWTLKKKYSL